MASASRDLQRAIARAGSAAGLARLLGVRPETVRGWVRRGITSRGKALLAGLGERRRAQAAAEKSRRQIFDELMKASGEVGLLPVARSKQGLRAGPRTSGYQWTQAVGKMLTQELIRELDAWLTSKRRHFPLFQAVVVASEYRKESFKGYKTVRSPLEGRAGAGDFAIEEQIATRRSTKLTEVRDELIGKLEDAIDEDSLMYVHAVTLFNYRLRTEEERKAWESGKRWNRKKKASRKQKTSKPKTTSPATKLRKKSVSSLSQRSPSSSKQAGATKSARSTSSPSSKRTTLKKSSTKRASIRRVKMTKKPTKKTTRRK